MKSENKTIRILANGGLGNQLFIWNLAHNLEKKYKCKIKIIVPKSGSDRVCEIFPLVDCCCHQIKVVESNMLNYSFGFLDRVKNKSSILAQILTVLFSVVETKLPSDSFHFLQKPPRFIRGYFQSPKLVEESLGLYKEELLNATELMFKNLNYGSSDVMSRKMLHIRRGDFTKNKETVGLLTIEYFLKQVEKDEKVVIFTDESSDDPEILKNFPTSLILGADSLDTWSTFSMLSHAGHLVASNSTFSWWAGVISLMRGGKVVAPQPWTLTNIYGDNYLVYEKFKYTQSIFEAAEPQNDRTWR
jgi:hypothetical protein